MLQVRSVVVNSEIDEVRLLEAHRLARLAFEPEIAESDHDTVLPGHRNMSLDLWREKLSIPHGNILYVTSPTPDGPSTSTATHPGTETESPTDPANEKMLGMFVNHPRVRDGLESYHIFISGVHPSARGQGLFPVLLDATRDYARSAGYKVLTVSTVPEKFGRMYEILSREGSGWEVVKWEGEEGKGVRKVVMKMEI